MNAMTRRATKTGERTTNLSDTLEQNLEPGEMFGEMRCEEVTGNVDHFKTYIVLLTRDVEDWKLFAFWGRIGARAQSQLKSVHFDHEAGRRAFDALWRKKLTPHGTGRYQTYALERKPLRPIAARFESMTAALEIATAMDTGKGVWETDGESTFVRFLEV